MQGLPGVYDATANVTHGLYTSAPDTVLLRWSCDDKAAPAFAGGLRWSLSILQPQMSCASLSGRSAYLVKASWYPSCWWAKLQNHVSAWIDQQSTSDRCVPVCATNGGPFSAEHVVVYSSDPIFKAYRAEHYYHVKADLSGTSVPTCCAFKTIHTISTYSSVTQRLTLLESVSFSIPITLCTPCCRSSWVSVARFYFTSSMMNTCHSPSPLTKAASMQAVLY